MAVQAGKCDKEAYLLTSFWLLHTRGTRVLVLAVTNTTSSHWSISFLHFSLRRLLSFWYSEEAFFQWLTWHSVTVKVRDGRRLCRKLNSTCPMGQPFHSWRGIVEKRERLRADSEFIGHHKLATWLYGSFRSCDGDWGGIVSCERQKRNPRQVWKLTRQLSVQFDSI